MLVGKLSNELAGLRPLALRDVCFCVTPENYFTYRALPKITLHFFTCSIFLPSTAAEEEAAPHVAIATAEFKRAEFKRAEFSL